MQVFRNSLRNYFLSTDRSPGSNESFAERLTTMGMPSETAVLVDACDPSSAPGTPLVEPRLTRIHSDTTVVVRKPPSPANGEKAVITNRPMSLMPSVRLFSFFA